MKLKLLFLPLVFLLIQSCTKEKNELMELNISPTNIAVKKIDMSDIETNYDTYVSELQSNPNLDITFGEFELKLREMKPAIGINVENTTILEDKMDNNTIIIDNSTQSIYVRSINTEEKYSYVLFAAKDASKIKDVLKLDDYNVEAIINSNSYQNRLNTSAEIGFVSNDNSFIIRKPILTSKEELLNVTEFGTSHEVGKDENHTQCHHSSYPLAPIKGEQGEQNDTIRNGQRIPSGLAWNIVIGLANTLSSRDLNVSAIIDGVKTAFKSLASEEGSNYYSYHKPYAELYISFINASVINDHDNRIYHHVVFEFEQFLRYFYQGYRNTTYIYVRNSTQPFLSPYVLTRHPGLDGFNGYRVAVSTNDVDDFVHQLGHTFSCDHYNSYVWDRSLFSYGLSLMHEDAGQNWWSWIWYKHKFYSPNNRAKVKEAILRHNGRLSY